jgi:hypothetical protein
MSANPYAAPKAALEARASGKYWRDGKVAVLTLGVALPPRCVKCNEAALQPMKPRKLYWHHSGWYLLILLNIVIYAIVAMIVRKKAEVTYGVCAKHRSRRRMFIAIGWGGLVLGVLALALDPLAGIVIAVAAVLTGLIGSRLAYPTRITKEEVRLGGCGEAFLASLERGAAPSVPAPAKHAAPAAALRLGKCPSCGARLPADAPQCLSCKAVLGPNSVLQN